MDPVENPPAEDDAPNVNPNTNVQFNAPEIDTPENADGEVSFDEVTAYSEHPGSDDFTSLRSFRKPRKDGDLGEQSNPDEEETESEATLQGAELDQILGEPDVEQALQQAEVGQVLQETESEKILQETDLKQTLQEPKDEPTLQETEVERTLQNAEFEQRLQEPDLDKSLQEADMLNRIAQQLRARASALKSRGEAVASSKPFNEKVTSVIQTTLSVMQLEVAPLIEMTMRSGNVSTDTHIEDVANGVDLEKPPPGDDANVKRSANVCCECHPTNAGAAVPAVMSRDATPSEANSFFCQTEDTSCLAKDSTHPTDKGKPSRIPMPSGRGCVSERKRKEFFIPVTCCSDKSAGVQTVLSLGKRLQSESLNSLSETESCRVETPNETSRLRPSRSYNIKLSGKDSAKVIKLKIRPFQERGADESRCGHDTDKIPVKLNQSSKSAILITITTSQPRVEARSSHSCPHVNSCKRLQPLSSKSTSCKEIPICPAALKMDKGTAVSNVSRSVLNEASSDANLTGAALNTVTTSEVGNVTETDSPSFSPAKCTCTNNQFDTYKTDPIMIAMETCETELKPLRRAFNELQQKVRDLKVPEMKGCFCETVLQTEGKPVQPRCAHFTPARILHHRSLPYGKLPLPIIPTRAPIELSTLHTSAVASSPVINSSRRRQHHSCCCKRKNRHVERKDKETQHKVRIDQESAPFCKRKYVANHMYDSSPFSAFRAYPLFYNTEMEGNQNCIEDILKNKCINEDHEVNESESCDSFVGRQRNGCCRKLSSRTLSKDKKENSVKSASSTTRLRFHKKYFDLQNLPKGQAIRADPDDFLISKD
ncbi:hypothetical protein PPYR_08013 [Photinus pyralis]|uniref:Uncharacterized protein n=1 Tax=Photinus pyralis TaxID=7054 RepID=A0A5N4AS83_PHOPY|nr:uncharacterized protein LOC116167560 [Photinus pyralis]KAB0800133.1 hypothetical protein PPYR_08013 [Photinus pyralis]